MRFDLFLQPLATAFALTVGFCLLFLLVPLFRRQVWRSGNRHHGKASLSRLGGLAMALSFLFTVVIDPHLVVTREIFGLLAGSVMVCLFGLWDDVREIGFKVQTFFQVAITVILFTFGLRITSIKNPFGESFMLGEEGSIVILFGFVLLLLWVFLVMNAVNWLDGLDGLLGGVVAITLVTIFFLSLKPEVNQPPVALLSLIGVGITAGFLFFNIHPAKLLAGTAGSLFLGFLITVLSIIAGTKIATALLVLSLPIADALWVIGERLSAGKSIFQPDKRHLHYKLRELGWSEGRIAWFFSLFTAVIAVIALNTEALGKFIAFLLVFTALFAFLMFVAERTRRQQR